jgi:Protein of unknown function (DUF2470)
VRRPTAAERARTLAYGIAGGVVDTPAATEPLPVPAHATDDEGRPYLLLPNGSPVVAALQDEPDLPAALHVSDVAPVALADRLRGQAWLRGWLTQVPVRERRLAAMRLSHLHPWPELLDLANPARSEHPAGSGNSACWTVLALEIAEVEVLDGWGHAVLEPEEYAAAAPDPFVALEPQMLEHLDGCHRAELRALFRHRFGTFDPEPAVRALGLDRYGLWLRCLTAGSDEREPLDLRVEFPAPVRDLHGLRCAYRRLFAGIKSQ